MFPKLTQGPWFTIQIRQARMSMWLCPRENGVKRQRCSPKRQDKQAKAASETPRGSSSKYCCAQSQKIFFVLLKWFQDKQCVTAGHQTHAHSQRACISQTINNRSTWLSKEDGIDLLCCHSVSLLPLSSKRPQPRWMVTGCSYSYRACICGHPMFLR